MHDSARPADRRLLVINPNTNPEVTRRIAEHVFDGVSTGLSIEVVNPATGPFSIETSADRDRAVPAVLDLIREKPDRDGYVLACFDDIAIDEARRLVETPVFSMAQAAIEAAASTGGRFTVVTTVEEQVPTIARLLEKYGTQAAGTVRACSVGVAEASERSARAEAMLDMQVRAAIETDGAETIILGSGAYAGRASELQTRYGVAFVEGLSAAIARAADPTRDADQTSTL